MTYPAPNSNQLPHEINALFSRLRSQIRKHVLVEGLALLAVWIVATFWISVGIDYLPVWAGWRELPTPVRVGLLSAISLGSAVIVARWILSRLFTELRAESLALLIERHRPEFRERLVTVVDSAGMNESTSQYEPRLMAATRDDAVRIAANIEPRDLLDGRRLKQLLWIAGVAVASIIGFGLASRSGFELAARRVYLLSDQPWPRTSSIRWVGAKIKYETAVAGIPEFAEMIVPENGRVYVGKGTALSLFVEALAQSPDGRDLVVPDSCQLRYRVVDGASGRQLFKRIGTPHQGRQLFTLYGPPLEAVVSNIRFSLQGGDDSHGGLEICQVENPVVVTTQLECQFPDYIIDQQSLRWTSRSVDWAPGTKLPEGTVVNVVCTTNKPLKRVYIVPAESGMVSQVVPVENKFQVAIPAINKSLTLQFFVVDMDGVLSAQPHIVNIEPITDQPPRIITSLAGIGAAITPQAIVPVTGSIVDDYGLRRSWIEVHDSQRPPLTQPVEVLPAGRMKVSVDFREQAKVAENPWPLPTAPGSQISLVVKALDNFNLRPEPNNASGDIYQLDIVTANQLVRILEKAEAAERRRLEQVVRELGDAKDFLVRSRSSGHAPSTVGREPGEQDSPTDSVQSKSDQNASTIPQATTNSELELRLLFSQRAAMQIEKSAGEIAGTAAAFENIRLQLLNNRLDAQDRDERLKSRVVAPLSEISQLLLSKARSETLQAQQRIRELITNPNAADTAEKAAHAVDKAAQTTDELLIRLNQVVSILLKFETQNELLDLVRQMIDHQETLLKRTKQERQKKAFDGLLDE
jgi:hypothetical protein